MNCVMLTYLSSSDHGKWQVQALSFGGADALVAIYGDRSLMLRNSRDENLNMGRLIIMLRWGGWR